MSPAAAHQLLHQLSQNSHELRWLIEGSGIAGEPSYVPWLIGHMENDRVARLAGEAFSLITGADLVSLQLERLPPENVESGPTEDPEDTSTEMDPDDGLPWPDPGRVEAWWSGNRAALQSGTRYFAGAPVRPDHCLGVLRAGTQRERILAAHYRGLLAPGTALFNTSAPAWRQQRMLASLE
jgi:uncharacterized protein (TIGR02270 family)